MNRKPQNFVLKCSCFKPLQGNLDSCVQSVVEVAKKKFED